jgi:4-hydroxy-3-methylbut-2-enyl diphosphate reductase
MEIIIAKYAGFCFGVRRAVDLAEKALESGRKVYCMGPLIHNQQVIEKLEQKGLVTVRNIADVPKKSLFLIRSHGIDPKIVEQIISRGGEILDATCPFVRRAQLVAKKFHAEKYCVVICGDPVHAEVIGINAWAGNSAKIIHDTSEIKKLKFEGTVGVLSQTTQKKELFDNVVKELSKKTKSLVVENTICLDSSTKQTEVSALAKKVDLMIVIGGKNSSNTGKLVQLSEAQKTPTKHIETASELQLEWFVGVKKVGIAAGASTAQFLIDEVVDKINNL